MEKRKLGKTGVELSVVGFGGIAVMDATPEDAARDVKTAIGRGINYFDVAPTYGNAEERLGPALEPYRDGVFLSCKTTERKRDKAAAQLQQSLKRLRTKHVDLYQLHGVKDMDEVKTILAPDGALEAFKDARDKGLVKHIGFSAHSEEAAIALMEAFDFTSTLFPVNYACWYEGRFGEKTLEAAKAKGVAVLALKALAKREWNEGEQHRWAKCWYAPVDSKEEAAAALRWTLSRPGVVAAVSPGHAELIWWMCDAVEGGVKRPTPAEEKALAESARGLNPIFEAKA